ncbi:DNA polymerase III subunit gamma/tau [Helicobacter sp. MIT 00-7814]|nr:DNA polymerase III subunit gamma/tau [Helicobacter sp. MIT 00-7814]RDU57767.1 DNA polymerase III subunit gamma/tau [Helicobacter sp. MIT 99-10781]
MMSLALALKYRPKTFDDLIGQHAVSQTLSLALDSKHISHAYLFSGLRGSGKTSSARIFSRCLQCENGPTSKPCGECENCKAALEGRHMDIIEMDGASSRKIEDIRALIEQTKYRPSFGRFKIFIIDEVHMLTREAFNALLKTLEEPPEYVKFILATTDPLKLPATILSRTQHFRFKQISQRLVVEHIASILNKENVSFEPQALEIIARSGSGSLRDTLTLLDQAIIFCKGNIDTTSVTDMLGVVDPQIFENLFSNLLSTPSNENTLSAQVEESLQVLQEYECEMILDEMMLFLKDKLLHHDKRFAPAVLDRFFRILVDSKYLLTLNTDSSFVLLLSLLKMQEALKIKDIELMIEDLENEIFGTSSRAISKAQTPQMPQNAQTNQNTLDSKNPSANSTIAANADLQNAPTAQPLQTPQSTSHILFEKLTRAIYDRSYDLGECFSKNVSFVDFSNDILSWDSKAQGNDKQILSEGFSFIKSKIAEIFGTQTKIIQVKQESQSTPQNTQEAQDSNQPNNVAESENPSNQKAPNMDASTSSVERDLTTQSDAIDRTDSQTNQTALQNPQNLNNQKNAEYERATQWSGGEAEFTSAQTIQSKGIEAKRDLSQRDDTINGISTTTQSDKDFIIRNKSLINGIHEHLGLKDVIKS